MQIIKVSSYKKLRCNPNHSESMKSNQTFAVSAEERAAQWKVLKYHAEARGYQCPQIIFLYGNQTYNKLLQIQNPKATICSTCVVHTSILQGIVLFTNSVNISATNVEDCAFSLVAQWSTPHCLQSSTRLMAYLLMMWGVTRGRAVRLAPDEFGDIQGWVSTHSADKRRLASFTSNERIRSLASSETSAHSRSGKS